MSLEAQPYTTEVQGTGPTPPEEGSTSRSTGSSQR
jgi:hypothetical protein